MKTRRYPHPSHDQRGSVLIVALILAAVVAISLTSYIKLASATSNISYRSHYAGVAMNAAESGLEQAMWSINKQKASSSSAWDGWDTSSGITARRTFDMGTVSGGGAVSVKVLVSDHNLTTSNPYAIARAIVTPMNGPAVEKWIKISLYQRSRFSNGLVAKKSITFSGNNPVVDSYNSANGAYTPSPSTTNRFPRGSAGSASVGIDSLSVGNADIYGYASIGSSDYSGLSVGRQGVVTGDFNAASGTVDYSHVSTDFTANFDLESAPDESSTSLGTINTDISLPKDPSGDAKTTVTDAKTGITTTTYYYKVSSIDLQNETLVVTPGYNVVLIVSGAIDVGGGTGSISVNSTRTDGVTSTSTLNIYVAGNVSITGQGVTNTLTTTSGGTTTTSVNRPQDLMIWGTNDSSQTIKIAGNGELSAVVYAPNASLEVTGGGNSGAIYGSYIANTIKMTGNDSFHYDESLKDLDSGEPLGIDKWDEFVSSVDRTSVGSLMDF